MTATVFLLFLIPAMNAGHTGVKWMPMENMAQCQRVKKEIDEIKKSREGVLTIIDFTTDCIEASGE
jgi:hypothetical protein